MTEALRPKVNRLGYVGAFFTHAAHQPDALLSFIRFTDDLKRALDDRLTELVALTVAAAKGNDYERHQHERLSIALGFSPAWVGAVEALDPAQGAEHLSDVDRAIQTLVLDVLASDGHGVADQVRRCVEAVGEAETVGILMLVGRYVAHALMANALALAPPVGSIFEEENT